VGMALGHQTINRETQCVSEHTVMSPWTECPGDFVLDRDGSIRLNRPSAAMMQPYVILL